MLNKNTVVDLWHAFKKIPLNPVKDEEEGETFEISEPFLAFRKGTRIDDIYYWFHTAYKEYGGMTALAGNDQYMDRRFTVETPVGTLVVYAKHEGVDSFCDYPGIYIDLAHTKEQKSGEEVGDLVCVVEYDSSSERLQIVPYADTSRDEPSFGEDYINTAWSAI